MPTFDKMMNEADPPLFARWETPERFYQAWLGQDLLGDWSSSSGVASTPA